jgi:hypothetical protein
MVDHKYSRFTVAQFLADGLSAAERIHALGLTVATNGSKPKKVAASRAK